LSTLFEGLSETANKGKMFDQHVWNEKSTHRFIDEIVDISLSATQIPLSIFTNSFHQRFEKHSILESMLEILQQFYIQMETEPHDFLLFPGDYSLYTLRCMRCGQHVTVVSLDGETLLDAPTAITEVIPPGEDGSDDNSYGPTVLQSNPLLSGKALMYQQYLESKQN
jgi:hypothetical protein